MLRLLVCTLFAGLILATQASNALAQKKKEKVEVTMKWSGSVADEKLLKDAPTAITSAAQFEAVWKLWKIDGDVPKVDFAKNIVVTTYSVGSKLNLAGASLDEKGNLEVLGFGTRDLATGFRYVFGVVSREGVKTVGGKALPKE